MRVEVVRSARRRKTVQARQVGDVLRISIPASMSAADEAHWVGEMSRRMEQRQSLDRIDLAHRAAALSDRYGLRRPSSIRWVANQEFRWGSCTPADGSIRISARLAREPVWVIDYVLVHELAHLSVAGHGTRFWDLVYRYPLAERARGFIMARGLESERPEDADGPIGAPAAWAVPEVEVVPERAPGQRGEAVAAGRSGLPQGKARSSVTSG